MFYFRVNTLVSQLMSTQKIKPNFSFHVMKSVDSLIPRTFYIMDSLVPIGDWLLEENSLKDRTEKMS